MSPADEKSAEASVKAEASVSAKAAADAEAQQQVTESAVASAPPHLPFPCCHLTWTSFCADPQSTLCLNQLVAHLAYKKP